MSDIYSFMVFYVIAQILKKTVLLKGETAANSRQCFVRFFFQRNLIFLYADISLNIVAGCWFDDD
jgi:hypothetical protein